MCAVLEFPASTYYAAKKREQQPSRRKQRDAWLKKEIKRVWEDRRKGRRVYGARKVWLQLRREGFEVARCTVARLMKELGIAGAAARRKKPRTTVPGAAGQRPADLLARDFSAPAPNRRWVADITYVETFSGQGACKFGDLRGWFAPGLMAGRVRAGHGVAFWLGCAVLAVGGTAAGFQVTAGLLLGARGVVRPRRSSGSW